MDQTNRTIRRSLFTGRSAQVFATFRVERNEAKGAPKINTAAF